MDTTRLLVFAAAYLAVLVLPGPGVTALVARVLARGLGGTPAFIAGFVAASNPARQSRQQRRHGGRCPQHRRPLEDFGYWVTRIVVVDCCCPATASCRATLLCTRLAVAEPRAAFCAAAAAP